MSIQNDLVNQNLTDADQYLRRVGIVSLDGTIMESYALLQDYLIENKDAIVARFQAAEAKALARKMAVEALAKGETATTTAS